MNFGKKKDDIKLYKLTPELLGAVHEIVFGLTLEVVTAKGYTNNYYIKETRYFELSFDTNGIPVGKYDNIEGHPNLYKYDPLVIDSVHGRSPKTVANFANNLAKDRGTVTIREQTYKHKTEVIEVKDVKSYFKTLQLSGEYTKLEETA